jgi:hypothetical protein
MSAVAPTRTAKRETRAMMNKAKIEDMSELSAY